MHLLFAAQQLLSSSENRLQLFLPYFSLAKPSMLLEKMKVCTVYLKSSMYLQMEENIQHSQCLSRVENLLGRDTGSAEEICPYCRDCISCIKYLLVLLQALPLTRFQAVVCLAVGRLQDKAVTVVKNAIQLLSAFLSNNPFSCKVSFMNLFLCKFFLQYFSLLFTYSHLLQMSFCSFCWLKKKYRAKYLEYRKQNAAWNKNKTLVKGSLPGTSNQNHL